MDHIEDVLLKEIGNELIYQNDGKERVSKYLRFGLERDGFLKKRRSILS